MGYTNYYKPHTKFLTMEDRTWANFYNVALKLKKYQQKNDPELELVWLFENECIRFDCDGIETAYVMKANKDQELHFCKTFQCSADKYVKALFCIAQYFSYAEVSCDGPLIDFTETLEIIKNIGLKS